MGRSVLRPKWSDQTCDSLKDGALHSGQVGAVGIKMSDQNHSGESPADLLTAALDKALERWEAREISLTYRGRDPFAKIPGWVAKALPRYGAIAKRMAAAGLTAEQLKTEHVRWEGRPVAAGSGNSALEAIEAMEAL